MDKMANIDSKNKPLDRKLKIEQQNQLKKPGVNSGAPDGKQFLHHKWYPSCYSCYKSDKKLLRRKARYDPDYD
jgi:hypothetical protein